MGKKKQSTLQDTRVGIHIRHGEGEGGRDHDINVMLNVDQ